VSPAADTEEVEWLEDEEPDRPRRPARRARDEDEVDEDRPRQRRSERDADAGPASRNWEDRVRRLRRRPRVEDDDEPAPYNWREGPSSSGFLNRNLIMGGVGVLWGGAVLIYCAAQGGAKGSGAYGAGQVVGMIFAVLMLLTGGFYLVLGIKEAIQTSVERPKRRKRRRRKDEEE
jgi:hypothetical protein